MARLQQKIERRHHLVPVIGEVFVALDAEKPDPEQSRDKEPQQQGTALPFGGGLDRQHDRQAAGQQQRDIEAAAPQFGVICRGGEIGGIGAAVDKIGEDQRAEEHHLGGDEHPHAELRHLGLLGEGGELRFRTQRAHRPHAQTVPSCATQAPVSAS